MNRLTHVPPFRSFCSSLCRILFRLLPFLFVVLTAAPLFGRSYSIQSVKDGPWTEPNTWKPARVPQEGDRVLISPDTEVTYDGREREVIRFIRIEGTLRFARDRSTRLDAGLIHIGHDPEPEETERKQESQEGREPPLAGEAPALEVGMPERPIPRPYTARIVLHHLDGLNEHNAPGIICFPGGRMEFHGAPMSRTWVELGATAGPDQRRVQLARDVSGWEKGDTVLVTGSRHQGNVVSGSFRDQPDKMRTEKRQIRRISGRTIFLNRPLSHEHFGSGKGRSEVANTTRTVEVRSADPDGIKGHTMYHRNARGSISYARFASLGKRNELGRYPIHFHRVRDTMRGSSVIGAAIVNSGNRWVTVHGTEYLVVRDCVGYRSIGHGYFLENGTEVYNILDRNIGIQAYKGKRLPDQALPFDPNDGAAFWWANGRNTFVRNVACENDRYGFRYDSRKQSNFDSRLPVRTAEGNREERDIRKIPVYRFESNESHTEGLYSFVFAGPEEASPDRKHPHVIKDLQSWQTHYALRPQMPNMLIDTAWISHAAYGIYRPWFDNHVYRDIHLDHVSAEPFNRGLDDKSKQHGKITVDGLTFSNLTYNGGDMPLIQISDNNLSGEAASHFRNVKVMREDESGGKWPVVNRGGGREVEPSTPKSVPVYLHDWYGPGKTARVVSVKTNQLSGDREYRKDPPLTGSDARVTTVEDKSFPELLEPVDDQPPATVVLWPRPGDRVPLNSDGTLTVRGTTTDNRRTRSVTVNKKQARDTGFNYHRWEVTLRDLSPGPVKIRARARDASGNRELTPHTFRIFLVQNRPHTKKQ